MPQLVEFDPVRTLFGNEPLPASYEEVLGKILNDNLVLIRAKHLMEQDFAARAIAQMREHEVDWLAKRITLAFKPAAPIPPLSEVRRREQAARADAPKPLGFVPATWTVMSHADNLGEKAFYLQANCDKCGQQIKGFDPSILFEHCGAVERVPDETVAQLRRAQGRPIASRPISDSEAYEQIIKEGQGQTAAAAAPAPARTPVAREKVAWFVEHLNGITRIKAQVRGEFMAYSGTPDGAEKFSFRGEQCPKSVIDEYKQARAGRA